MKKPKKQKIDLNNAKPNDIVTMRCGATAVIQMIDKQLPEHPCIRFTNGHVGFVLYHRYGQHSSDNWAFDIVKIETTEEVLNEFNTCNQ